MVHRIPALSLWGGAGKDESRAWRLVLPHGPSSVGWPRRIQGHGSHVHRHPGDPAAEHLFLVAWLVARGQSRTSVPHPPGPSPSGSTSEDARVHPGARAEDQPPCHPRKAHLVAPAPARGGVSLPSPGWAGAEHPCAPALHASAQYTRQLGPPLRATAGADSSLFRARTGHHGNIRDVLGEGPAGDPKPGPGLRHHPSPQPLGRVSV